MKVSKAIEIRRSVRKYLPDLIPESDLKLVLEAGRNAPSAKNTQAWRFIVVDDNKKNQILMEACHNQPMVGEAPINIVVIGEGERIMTIGQDAVPMDASIALSFMLLQATELGLGTCWLGRVDAEKVKDLLCIPKDWHVIGVTPLGYTGEKEPRKRCRKTFEEVVSYNRF